MRSGGCRDWCVQSGGAGVGASKAGGGGPCSAGGAEAVHTHQRCRDWCMQSGGAGMGARSQGCREGCTRSWDAGSGCAHRWPPARLEGGGEPGLDYTSFSPATVLLLAYLHGPLGSKTGSWNPKELSRSCFVFHLWVPFQLPSLKFRDGWKNSALKH